MRINRAIKLAVSVCVATCLSHVSQVSATPSGTAFGAHGTMCRGLKPIDEAKLMYTSKGVTNVNSAAANVSCPMGMFSDALEGIASIGIYRDFVVGDPLIPAASQCYIYVTDWTGANLAKSGELTSSIKGAARLSFSYFNLTQATELFVWAHCWLPGEKVTVNGVHLRNWVTNLQLRQ